MNHFLYTPRFLNLYNYYKYIHPIKTIPSFLSGFKKSKLKILFFYNFLGGNYATT
jgi:hypothetical protein